MKVTHLILDKLFHKTVVIRIASVSRIAESTGICRDDSRTQKTSLDRMRSGWLKAEDEGTSLRSLHAAARRHMGVSIPAVAYPLGRDGNADTSVKPQPVTLFFGIIDFLQVTISSTTEHLS